MKKFLLILIVIIGLLFGCSNEKQNDSLNIENTSTESDTLITNEEIATHLAKIANDVPNVNSANALIAGPYTVVAIDINEELDRQDVGVIKYTVSEALTNDQYGKSAVVIADADIVARFQEMREKIKQGYPVQGVVEELANIVSRYMPTFPVPDQPPNNDNENKLNEGEEKELDNIQKEHMNEK